MVWAGKGLRDQLIPTLCHGVIQFSFRQSLEEKGDGLWDPYEFLPT